jgi:hypothetical protein
MLQFGASETLQERFSNASVTLQKRSTSGKHVLLDVFIHCGRFHDQWARRVGTVPAFFHIVQSELATPYVVLKRSTIILAILRSMEKGYWIRARELPSRRP